MKIITLCGSTKFKAEFEKAMAEETLKGNIVISVGLFGHEIGMDMNSETKRKLDQLHFRKIDMSDEVFIINPGGYIGLSTCDELHYAIACGKSVRFLADPYKKKREVYSCGCGCNPDYGHCPSCMHDNYSDETRFVEE